MVDYHPSQQPLSLNLLPPAHCGLSLTLHDAPSSQPPRRRSPLSDHHLGRLSRSPLLSPRPRPPPLLPAPPPRQSPSSPSPCHRNACQGPHGSSRRLFRAWGHRGCGEETSTHALPDLLAFRWQAYPRVERTGVGVHRPFTAVERGGGDTCDTRVRCLEHTQTRSLRPGVLRPVESEEEGDVAEAG